MAAGERDGGNVLLPAPPVDVDGRSSRPSTLRLSVGERHALRGSAKYGAGVVAKYSALATEEEGADRDPADVYDEMGGWGRYQTAHAAASFFTAAIVSMHVMVMYYVHLPIEPKCTHANCTQPLPEKTGDYDIDDWCDSPDLFRQAGWELDGPSSIKKDWELICGRAWLVALSDSMLFAGWFTGGLLSGKLGDKYGRRRPLAAYGLCCAGALALTAAAHRVETYILAKFFHGLFLGPLLLTAYVYGSEFCPPRHSATFGAVYFMVAAAGSASLAAAAWALQDSWRTFTLTVAAATVATLVWPAVGPESPLWLASVGRGAEARAALAPVARLNRAAVPAGFGAAVRVVEDSAAQDPGPAALLSFPAIRRLTVFMTFVWLACSLCYFGLGLSGATLPGDAYLNAALLSMAELPMYPLQIWLVDMPVLGRRRTMIGSLAIGATACFLCLLPIGEVARWFAFVGNMFMTMAFTTTYVWAAEAFPADVRASGMGVCTAGGKVGSMGTPFIVSLGEGSLDLAMGIFGAVAIAGGLAASALPETRGRAPPPTLRDFRRAAAAPPDAGAGADAELA